ncbi:MAG: phosphatase PAP2 family protein [Prevotella sp.]|nr:phosphatase PAP2 family protein [Prevotella sp.]
MNNIFSTLLARERKPVRGLMAFEWAVLAYLLATTVMLIICYTDLVNPGDMIFGRVKTLVIMALLWGVYRMVPCRLTAFMRAVGQMAMLPWWYTDTYELNRILPNLDHIFARADQSLFGCQPALTFAEAVPWGIFSEPVYLGYYSYFYLIVAVLLMYFAYRYEDFIKAVSVVLCSFFVYYIIFDLVPVTGPQYYYNAIGMDNVRQGIFPDVGSYFLQSRDMIPPTGWDGFCRSLVRSGAVLEGERATAAFPSSHIGISTIVGCLLARLCKKRGRWGAMYVFVPFFVFLCMATVYIRAHYLVDAIAGFFSGLLFYFMSYIAFFHENRVRR